MPRIGGQTAKFVIRDNLRHRRDIESAYCRDPHREAGDPDRQRVFLSRHPNPPRADQRRGARGPRHAAPAGPRRIRAAHYASRALYGQLLAAGVGIQEYHQAFLHAKVAVVDDTWATVGSSNIDPYSLLMAREANVRRARPGFQRAVEGGSSCG